MRAQYQLACAQAEQQQRQQQQEHVGSCKAAVCTPAGADVAEAAAGCKSGAVAAVLGLAEDAGSGHSPSTTLGSAGDADSKGMVASCCAAAGAATPEASQWPEAAADVDADMDTDSCDSDPEGSALFCKSGTGRLVTVSIKVRAAACGPCSILQHHLVLLSCGHSNEGGSEPPTPTPLPFTWCGAMHACLQCCHDPRTCTSLYAV